NSQNDDASQKTFKKENATFADAGIYRWKMVNSVLTELTLESEPINVIIEERTPVILDRYAFQYRYDGRKRMTHKKVPGADWVYMVYDDRDRLVMTQDGNQRAHVDEN